MVENADGCLCQTQPKWNIKSESETTGTKGPLAAFAFTNNEKSFSCWTLSLSA